MCIAEYDTSSVEETNYVMNGTKVRGPFELWPPNQTFESLFSHLNAIACSGFLLGAPSVLKFMISSR